MVNVTTTLSNFKVSFIGKDDKLLSVDAIQEPAEHLHGAKPGPARDFLTSIFTPSAALQAAVAAVLAVYNPVPAGYAVPGVAAILVKKGSMVLEEADLGANRIKPIILELGMEPGILEGLLADLQHVNTGRPSGAQAAFHVLSALLASIARIGAEHQLWPEPAFLSDFPAPLHSDLPVLQRRGEEGEGKDDAVQQEAEDQAGANDGAGQGGADDDSVTLTGVRAAPPRGAAVAPPLFDVPRPNGGANAVRPASTIQVGCYMFSHLPSPFLQPA